MVGEVLHLCSTTFCGKKGQPSGPPQWLGVAQELLEADSSPSPLSQQETLKWSTEKLHLAAISGPFDFLSFPSQGGPGIWLREGEHCRGDTLPAHGSHNFRVSACHHSVSWWPACVFHTVSHSVFLSPGLRRCPSEHP